MRKSALCFVLLIAFFVAVTGCTKKTGIARIVFVNFLSGDVSIVNGAVKTPAKVGDLINEGLGIVTGAKSFVEVALGDNVIKIMENTSIQVERLSVNANEGEDSAFFLSEGVVVSRVIKKLGKDDSYTITTPTAVASVRGTDFIVRVEKEKNKSYVACIEGKVEVRDTVVKKDAASVDLDGGKIVYVETEPVQDKPQQLVVQDLPVKETQMYKEELENIQPIREDIKKQIETDGKAITEEPKEEVKPVVQAPVVNKPQKAKTTAVQSKVDEATQNSDAAKSERRRNKTPGRL